MRRQGAEMTTTKKYQDMTKAERKQLAKREVMEGIAKALGYWTEQELPMIHDMSQEEMEDFGLLMQAQADRVAKLLGYKEAWYA